MKRSDHDKYFAHRYTLDVHEVDPADAERILRGRLLPLLPGDSTAEIVGGIPRFVPEENYAANFGLQWNTFRSTQLDSRTGLPLSANRFWSNTRWHPDELAGKTVLEVGSGAGRFTEILLGAGACVASVDYSAAIEANHSSNGSSGDALFAQADLYDLPFADASFDFVFCYGVLQHTPDPDLAYRRIFAKLRPGGRLSIDYYRKFHLPNVWATPKYLWRPFVKDMEPARLLRLVQGYLPLWFPVDNAIRHIPRLGPGLLAFVPIPCWNYVGSGLSYAQRKEWAVLDTFDALGAAYDEPRTREEVAMMVASTDNAVVDVFHGGNGVVANVTKAVR